MTEKRKDYITLPKGEVRVSNEIVARIAQIAAKEVEGVAEFSSNPIRWLNFLGLTPPNQGVKVEVGTREVAVDIDIAVEYGSRIPDIVKNLRKNVSQRITEMTGLDVVELNIRVNDLHFTEDSLTLTERGEMPEPRVR
jgi:uncharacterized alkaline shock family protein YloU